ncbi:hypothetical protein ETB97_003785 [Aspergillus alliaceus]|uniref:Uncharacterized protein n=1 Tax=Petromyces alliaceus TaxID=209559 RepID=A0A8H6E543_PETAA|nr:hypothetical protein ETB97_003785 [Aspergillus burnettii]
MECPIINEHFRRLSISRGYVAQHMLPLESVKFYLEHSTPITFSFCTDLDPITAEWFSIADPAYHPDSRVAEAWGVRIEDFNVDPEDTNTVKAFACLPLTI